MIANADFHATVNGVDYDLKKGQEFKGDAIAAELLGNLGFLAEKPKESKKAGKAEKEEVIQDER